MLFFYIYIVYIKLYAEYIIYIYVPFQYVSVDKESSYRLDAYIF